MVRKRSVRAGLVAVAFLMLIPAAAVAQSGIAGVVKDTTGAVLPGVTVEAASPALIEKVRTVVTDDQGQYKIVDLRPGVYTVTFTLPGFSTVKREGIELPASFTAAVNADMKVGELTETVTVTGASPVVDVQNIVQGRVVNKDVVTALPTARTFQTIGTLTPGIVIKVSVGSVTQDVGGSAGDANQPMAIHGGRTKDMQEMVDGMYFNNTNQTNMTGVIPDMGTVQEASYQVGAISAEYRTGGVHVNLVPKEGGNRFTGTAFGAYSSGRLQSDNTTADLLARGLGTANALDKIWDINGTFGGPIRRDRLWFLASGRYWGQNQVVAGMFYNKTPVSTVYTPDYDRPLIDDTSLSSRSGRLTWQVTPRNKVNIWGAVTKRCFCHNGGTAFIAPEATRALRFPENHMETVTWSAPLTNRLLLEAGVADNQLQISFYESPDSGVQDGRLAITEQATGLNYRSRAGGYRLNNSTLFGAKAAMSYVTGSHAFKVGMYLQRGWVFDQTYFYDTTGGHGGAMDLTVLNGVPRSVRIYTTPYESKADLNATLGIYAQDQWTIKRLTLNVGARYDYLNASVPTWPQLPGQFVGARSFPEVKDLPNWHDLVPRLGASYDLFGNGKTAVKVSLSKYVEAETTQFVRAYGDPTATTVNSATRAWTDTNGNFFPDCVMTDPNANNECGPLSPRTFGQRIVTTRVDDDVRTGFGKRGFNWEGSAGVQHELFPRVAVEATYTRRWFGNFLATDNLLVNPSDYDPYCITAPVDARLPGGGGYQICGLYDINPSKFGQVDNLVTRAKNYGDQYEYWHGVDLTVNARLPRGIVVSGGVDIGQRVSDNCDVIGKVDNPVITVEYVNPASPTQLYCHQATRLTQAKFLGVYPLPWWGIQASGTFQRVPGPPINASYPATSAQIRPSLGRNLSSGAAGTATIHLIQPGTQFDTPTYQVDARLSKIFMVGRTRIQGNFDLYNLFNASPVLLTNSNYGPSWLRPQVVLPGRLIKFGMQVDF